MASVTSNIPLLISEEINNPNNFTVYANEAIIGYIVYDPAISSYGAESVITEAIIAVQTTIDKAGEALLSLMGWK